MAKKRRFGFGSVSSITKQPAVSGAIGGILARAGAQFMSPWGGPIATIAGGYLLGNPVLETLGGYQLGSQFNLLGMVGFGGSTSGATGGL